MNKLSIKDHLIESVRRSEFSEIPFCHRMIQEIFSNDVYDKMQLLLPPNGAYHELRHRDAIQPDGTSARLEFGFSSRELENLEPEQKEFWTSMGLILRSPDLIEAFREALIPGLEERFKQKWRDIVVTPTPLLVRDLLGYKISIHQDVPQKAMTVQFYLPKDTSQRHLGTSFYSRTTEKSFTKVKQMNFLPNTGYAFAVGANSWHGVDPVYEQDGVRNSLMIIYYLKR
jgi:hypothetical protein